MPWAPEVQIQRGATSSIWLGRMDDGRLVAVKRLSADPDRAARRRLLAQGRLARAAHHPRVLAPVLLDGDRRAPTTVWPWVAGRDLASRLARHGRPDGPWAEAIATEIDDIVAVLHDQGLVHGRLTADHVLIDIEGRPMVIGLDPGCRASAEARADDVQAAAALRAQLIDGEDADDGGEGRPEAALGAPNRARFRGSRLPLAAGLAVTVIGALVGIGRAREDAGCPGHDEQGALSADVDGDGCDDPLAWSARTGVLSAETATGPLAWRIGAPGDRFLLDDWNCDGTSTPGLRRPRTGRTYAFPYWPQDGDPEVEATLIDPNRDADPNCPPSSRE